jgi:hypothetical protein
LLLLILGLPSNARAVDLDHDGKGDLVWYHARTGDVGVWLMDGVTTRGAGITATVTDANWEIVGTGDVDGDGNGDLVWQHRASGAVGVWLMNGVTMRGAGLVTSGADLGWRTAGIGDLDGDGKADLVRHHVASGEVEVWLMNGLAIRQAAVVQTVPDRGWRIAGVGDVDNDDRADLVWHHALTGEVGVWLMNGATIRAAAVVTAVLDREWQFVGVGDANGDGKADLVGHHTTTGDVGVWLLDGFALPTDGIVATVDDPGWQISSLGDADGDGRMDVIWYHTEAGHVAFWLLDGFAIRQGVVVGTVADRSWQLQPAQPVRAAPLAPGEPVGGEISVLGQSGLFEFWLDAPTRVVVQATRRAGGVNPCVEVYTGTPAQLVAGGAACAVDRMGKFARLDLTLAAGTYSVVVRDAGDNDEGNYNVLFLPVTGASSAPLGAGEPLLDTLDRVGDINLYQFTLDAPTRVVVEGTRWPGVNGVSPCLEVYTGNPAQLVSGGAACAENTAAGRVGHLDLQLAAGTYFVAVGDAGAEDKGKYHVLLLPLTEASGAILTPGVPETATISVVGDVNLHEFTLATDTRVTVQVLRSSGGTNGINPCVEVYSGDPAQPVAGGAICAAATSLGRVGRVDLTLPAGTHFVAVRDAGGDHKGDYRVLVLPVTAAVSTSLAVGVPQTSALGEVGEVDLYQFSLPVATGVQVWVTRVGKGSRVNPCLEVYAGTPAQPVPGGAVCADTTFAGQVAQVNLALAAGTYFVIVHDAGEDDIGDYEVLAIASP